MPIIVKAVTGKPYGKAPRFCLQIESGYRAGKLIGDDLPTHWPSREAAESWARETGYAVVSAGHAAATKLLVNLFETFSDFQDVDRDISGADLVDDLGRWLRKHKDEIATMPAMVEPSELKLKELFTRFRALHVGDIEVNGGDLVDDFGEWLRETMDLMADFTGAPFVAKVAKSPDDNGYWNERFGGWVDLDDATIYFETVPAGLRSNAYGEWVDLELNAALSAGAEADVSPRA